jgi:hypothetical protein
VFMNNRNKVLIAVLSICILIIASIILSLYLISRPTNAETQKKELTTFLEASNRNYIPDYKLKKVVNDLKNKTSKPADQYKDLTLFAFTVQDAYFKSNQPEVREYLKELNEKAKVTYPTLHKDVDFLVTCADPKCGSKPDPEESKLLQNIQNLTVDNLY